jgi:hypothetical protein
VAHLTFQIRRRTKLRKRKRRKEKSFMCVCDGFRKWSWKNGRRVLAWLKRLKQIYCSWSVWFSGKKHT